MDLGMAWSFLTLVMFICILEIHVGSSAPLEGCPKHCGNVNISYPFGVGDGCSYDGGLFRLTCNNSYDPPKLFIGNIEVINTAPESSQITVNLPVSYQCYHSKQTSSLWSIMLNDSPFRMSFMENVFTAVGCDTWAFIEGTEGVNYTGGCISMCKSEKDVVNGSCDGIGCCQTSIPQGIRMYAAKFLSGNNHTGIEGFNPCSYSFLVEKAKYNFTKADLNMNKRRKFPVVLDWAIGNVSCEKAKKNMTVYACVSKYSDCYESLNDPGYNCICSKGYEGNPYLHDGCQDTDKCTGTSSTCAEGGICNNTNGSFTCTCRPGTEGDPYREGCIKTQIFFDLSIALAASLSGGIFFLLSVGCCILIYKRSKKIRKKKLRRKNFNQNTRQLEMKLIASHGDAIERTKFFTQKELEKATNNFDKTRIIGEGGHGTVYKGLLSDQRVTAIKTSKVMNQIEKEEFINEVALLSRIYHRNVVMLYGCCLETEVPLLVYEFISNGTLSDHLHARDRSSHLCWDDRLRIATEVSAAMAYLHSASSKTIFHRDLKSANILLDEKLTTKLSDFGASKYVGSDQTHITATVQGTVGYLDPEYYQSGKLTEKSDVYSLGVILVELFTGEKPISNARSQEERNIIMHFIKLLTKNQVEQIFDTCIVKEAKKDEIEVFARLAGGCLRFKGEERPTMKEVVSTLEGIVRSKTKQKDQIYQEETINLLSFDISKIESSSETTTTQQNSEESYTTGQSYI